MLTQTGRTSNWFDFGEESSNVQTGFDDDSDQYLSALTRDEEQEAHSPFITGYKYVSGGAGEGRQHLSPTGEFPNHLEVKTDEELPSYCDPPNPCPLGFEAEDCDASPMSKFTVDYSRLYQTEQDCQCDSDHDRCAMKSLMNVVSPYGSAKDVLKRSRRVRRETNRNEKKNRTEIENKKHRQQFHKGQSLRFHVAKKSPIALSS